MKRIYYALEYFGVLLIFSFFRIFSISNASNIGGFLAKNIGPLFKKEYKKAKIQLGFVFPSLNSKQKCHIIKGMYENIGRFAAEYINQNKMDEKYFKENVVFEEEEVFLNYIKQGCFATTGHFGNWEVLQRFLGIKNANINVIYKPIYNPLINKIYLKQRNINQIPKGQNAMKHLLTLLKERKSIGILIDQRERAGEIFQFFGKPARTSTVIQRLAIKYDFKIIPVMCVRRKDDPNKFIIRSFPPLSIENTENVEKKANLLTYKTLAIIEKWIKEDPESWMLWTYSRWRINF